MPENKRRVWLDNAIYLSAGLAAVALVVILAILRVPFPRVELSIAITTLILGGNIVSFYRKKLRTARVWACLIALMALHVVLTAFLLERGLPVVIAFFLMVPEFFVISWMIRWATASESGH